MATQWVVTTAAERISLDAQKRGETTFTVTNPGNRADRAVFEVVPGDGADRAWFSVEEPQRLIRGNASVAYLLKVAIVAGTPAGSYAVQGRVYSADSAPEESSVLSGRLMLEVKPEPKPEPKKIPWWIFVVAGLVAVVLFVVGWLVFTDGPARAAVPDVAAKSEVQAVDAIRAAGLTIGKITHRHSAEQNDVVLVQSAAPGTELDAGTAVDLEVAVTLTAAKPTAPANGTKLPRDAKPPALAWTQDEAYIARWRVAIDEQACFIKPGALPVCQWNLVDTQWTDKPALDAPQLSFIYPGNLLYPSGFHTGVVQWRAFPIDEFGGEGPASAPVTFQVGP